MLGGTLGAYITERRASGDSWDSIARQLYADSGQVIEVTGVTVANWERYIVDEPDEATA